MIYRRTWTKAVKAGRHSAHGGHQSHGGYDKSPCLLIPQVNIMGLLKHRLHWPRGEAKSLPGATPTTYPGVGGGSGRFLASRSSS